MSGFVDECRTEWRRLGVPEHLSNEMAADLSADLAEAEAEGVSPEEVLGNGVFDAKAFAASWATARGLVHPNLPAPGSRARPGWAVAVSALVSLVTIFAGLVIAVGRQGTSIASTAFRHPLTIPRFFPRSIGIGPHLSGSPVLLLENSGFRPLGVILVVVGLIGLCVTLWLWKPWSTHRRRPRFDESVGLPSFL